jgi:Gpi18-like mannosyltransferase
MPIFDLYLIKILSQIFEVLSAFALCMIIAKLKRQKFSWILFGLVLLFPAFLLDSAVWGQCDAIYTFFVLIGLYFAITKRSFKACLFLGLGLAVKLQAILSFPILLVLLLAKTDDGRRYVNWKHLFIIPMPFFVLNCVPIFAGKNVFTTFGVYLKQANEHRYLSFVTNIPKIFAVATKNSPTLIFNLVVIFFVMLTVAWLSFVLFYAIKTARKRVLLVHELVFLTILTVGGALFIMPLMHERFLYIAMLLGFVLVYTSTPNQVRGSMVIFLTLGFAITAMFVYYFLQPGWWLKILCFVIAAISYTAFFLFANYKFVMNYYLTKPNNHVNNLNHGEDDNQILG